jgi:transposase
VWHARRSLAAMPNLRMRDELGSQVEDRALAHLFPRRGQPAERPWRLALITMFQFVEDLSDRQAADAVRARIDWKYALGLDLDNPNSITRCQVSSAVA